MYAPDSMCPQIGDPTDLTCAAVLCVMLCGIARWCARLTRTHRYMTLGKNGAEISGELSRRRKVCIVA